jgi:methionyl aminopeptidase
VIVRKTSEEIEKMAASGAILARCLQMLRSKARPGVTTLDLDAAAEASRARSARRPTR